MTEEVVNLPVVESFKAEVLDSLAQIDFYTVDSSSNDIMMDDLVYSLLEIGERYSK